MKTIKLSLIQPALSTLIMGVIGTLGLFLVWETLETWWVFVLALVLIGCGIFLAKKAAHHFHGHHHHAGDSLIDTIPIGVLFLANILHPAVDGFSVFQTFSHKGVVAGAVIIGLVVLHEIIRQAALIAVFRTMGIRWYWVVGTAFLGITVGATLGILGSSLIEKYEYIADLATVFAYSFIVTEYYLHAKEGKGNWKMFWVIIGILIAVLLQHYMHLH